MKKSDQKFQQLKDKTFIITHTIPAADIQHEYQHVLGHAAEHVDIKGFRKGKAPLDVVESHLDKSHVLEEVAQNLISHVYSDQIKEHDLKPIIQPQIKVLNPPVTLEKDWEIEITGCELPDVELGSLEDKIKKINTAKTTKKEDAKEAKDNKTDSEKKLDKIFDTILDTVKVNLPPILVDADVQSRISQLVDQTNQAGISVTQYLKSKNKTPESYQEEVKQQVTKEWTLNLTIDKLATDHKIEVDQKEIESLVSKNREAATNINMLAYVMRQQKVIEYLQNLK